ncbi:MAG: hypothetical protein HYX92_17325 [Chloroflexi bacterium]|nr:hypothetical protein [Chloroflexota bacterium]
MPGALNSGRNLVIELSPQTFGDIVLSGLRRDETRACANGSGVWVLSVNVTDSVFNWVEQRSNSPTPQVTFPVPYDIDQVRDRFPRNLSFLEELLGTAPSVQAVNVRSANPLAIAAGYDLDRGSPTYLDLGSPARLADPWESFQENFLTVNGAAHDWGVAIEPAIVQQVLDVALASLARTSIEINQETEDFFIERFVIETISGTYGDPVQIHVRGEVIKSGPDVDVEFDLTGRFVLVGPDLWLDLELVPGTVDIDTWDGVQTLFSDPLTIIGLIVGGIAGGIVGATGGGLTGAIVAAIRGSGDPSLPVPSRGLGQVEFRLDDGSRFIGTDVAQRSDGLVIVGDATVPVPFAPRLVTLGSLVFVETLDSACAGGAPVFPIRDLVLLNEDGREGGPLRICRMEGPTNPAFQVARSWNPPVTVPPDAQLGIGVRYTGPRGADVADTIRITCNDPRRMVREIPLVARAGGQAAYRVDPSPVVEVLVANTPTGRPVVRMGRCRAIAVPDRAAEFTVRNSGDGVLFLCDGVLDDPDGVFVVSYSRETLQPYAQRTYPILFYPTQAMHDYHATFRIQSNAGEIVVPIHGRVDVLPERTKDGMTAYLPTDDLCVPPDALCRIEGMFEPRPGGESILLQVISFFDMPPDGEIILSDPQGAPQVHDYSRHRTRSHALAYTPLPDGSAGPGQPCTPDFRGMGPGDRELVRIGVSGWSVLPVERFAEIEDVTAIASAGGWVYAATSQGLAVLDWRETNKPTLRNRIGLGPVRTLALSRENLFAAVGGEIIELDLERPDHPVPSDSARLEGDVTALGATRGRLFALDGRQISAFESSQGKLLKKSAAVLPDGVGQLGLLHDGVYVAGGKTLALYNLDQRLELRLADRAATEQPFETLSHFGRNIFLSGRSDTRVFEVTKDPGLRATADYRQRHWSVDFLPDLEHKRLFRLTKGQVELWQMQRRRLDRSRFQDSLRLRYLPKQPEGRDMSGT